MPDGAKFDHVLIRIKDGALLLMSLGAILSWVIGVTQLPVRVEATEEKVKGIEIYMVRNEVFVNGLGKDIDYIKKEISSIASVIEKMDKKIR